MKKLLMTFACVTGAFVAANANSITILNLLPCTYTISMKGLGDPADATTGFETAYFTLPANGTLAFPSPSAVPGSAGLPAGAEFFMVKGENLGTPVYGFGVGATGWAPPTFTSPTGVPCNSGNAYNVYWQTNAAGNVTVLIM